MAGEGAVRLVTRDVSNRVVAIFESKVHSEVWSFFHTVETFSLRFAIAYVVLSEAVEAKSVPFHDFVSFSDYDTVVVAVWSLTVDA